MRLIKRYSNRKLYDTIDKKYVTLENIELLIKKEEDINIIDNDSNQDITTSVLSQIIAEKAKKESFSPSLFLDIIKKGKGNMYSYFSKIVQTLGETAYFVEEEIRGKVKDLISSGEMTQEEGDELCKDLSKNKLSTVDKIEMQLESLYSGFLNKLNIPDKDEVKKLRSTIEKLEKQIQEIENIQEQEQSKENLKRSKEDLKQSEEDLKQSKEDLKQSKEDLKQNDVEI